MTPIRPRTRVTWLPTKERGTVQTREGDVLWIRWDSGRYDRVLLSDPRDAAALVAPGHGAGRKKAAGVRKDK